MLLVTSDVIEEVRSIVCRLGDLPAIEADADFYSAGFSSINALSLLIELETVCEVSIPDERFIAARTFRDLAALIELLKKEQGE